MALLNQAITINGKETFETKKSIEFAFIKNAGIEYRVKGSFCVNNCFVTIQSLRDGNYRGKPSFREYVFISDTIEIIFNVDGVEARDYLQKYLHRINYFGKRGCFFQFVQYNEDCGAANVKEFDTTELNSGLLQEFDEVSPKAQFKNLNNFDSSKAMRDKKLYVIPVENLNSSKSYTHYRCYQ